ncbi:lipase, partial [Bacillus vallismortis]|nr:lipase [Bacillus vallismortis]
MSKNVVVPKISDREYYYISQISYDYETLKNHLKTQKPLKIKSPTRWYVDQIKSDDDTGLDAVVLVQAEQKNGKWVKSKNPENVVVSFAGTDLTKDPINDGV